VANVAPTASLGNNGPTNEGSSTAVSFSGQSDPSSVDTSAGFHYAFSCSNGDLSAASYANSGTSSSTSCLFDDGPSTHTVKGRIIDKDGGYTEYSTNVTVSNVPPTADLTNNGPVGEGSPATISFSNQHDPSTTDTNAGFHYAYSCTNGDLSSASYNNTTGSTGSHLCPFADNGLYPVKARIIDKNNGFSEYTTTVTVNNVAPTVTAAGNQS